MKFYRLSETHPTYGIMGKVIPRDEWFHKVPYGDKPLFSIVDEAGAGHAYKVEVFPTATASAPVLFYLVDYGELVILLTRVCEHRQIDPANRPVVIPKKNHDISIDDYRLKIIYRKEWDDQ